MYPTRKLATLTALVLLNILAGCQQAEQATPYRPNPTLAAIAPVTEQPGTDNSTPPPTPMQTSTAGPSSLPGESTTANDLIKLDWELVDTIPTVSPLKSLPSGATLITNKKLDDFGGIEVSVYIMADDENHIYAMLSTTKGLYDLGVIGAYNYRKSDDIMVEAVQLFKEKVLKITGGLGANNSLSNYYEIDAKDNPVGLLQVDTGHSREVDVDRDGFPEAVSAHGSPMTAYVYRWNDNHVEVAFVNDALKADSVVLTDEMVYEASSLGSEQKKQFWLIPEGLIPAQ